MKRNYYTAVQATYSMQHAAQLCALMAAGLLLSACKPETKLTEDRSPSDAYTLISVNGNKIPAAVSHEGTVLHVRSGTFTIHADGTCMTKTVFIPPSGSEVTREVSASYTKAGSTLTMQWKGAGTTTGTIEGSTFTMDNEGMLFVYRK